MRNLALLAGILFAFLPGSRAFSQIQPILDQNPARIKWFQVATPRFRVIFPAGFDREALRTANTLQHIYTPVSRTLGREPRPISVVLQNQTAVSNGFVTLTPRRSEFFTTPPQDFTLLGNNDWLDLLAVHEFRHVVQYDKALTGFSRGMYYLFGNNGLSLVSTTVPSWFWEGDAVGTETALTEGGRGRIPAFDLALRTQLLTRGPFSYSKAYLRSYKDFVPNHYVLGYFMTTYLKRHHGAEAWGRILTRTYNVPFQPFRFSWAIRKETGMKVETLYRQTVRELDSLWTGQVAGLPAGSAVAALPTDQNKVFTNYEYPQYLSDGRILAQKSGLAHIDQFVTLGREGGEQRVYVPGFLGESVTLSVAADRLVWTERAFNPRWGLRDYSVLKVYDLRTRRKRQISRQTRLGAPAFSPDGKQIVAVRVLPSNAYNLVLLDGETGQELKTFENPENAFYTAPRFAPDGQAVVAVKRTPAGKTIERIAVATGERRDLVPYTGLNLSNPVAYGDYVYFNAPRNGIDNIFAVHVPTGRQYQVTDRKFGAYNATLSPDGREMAFQDFTPGGFRIATQPVDTTTWTPLSAVTDRMVAYYQPLIAQEGGHSVLEDVPQKQLPVRRYRQWKQLFNPYSWGPLVSSSGEALEVSLASQDLLSTTLVNVGYGYDANQNTGRFFANLSYQGWYPVLDATFSTGVRQTAITVDNVRQDPDTTFTDTWRENRFSAGVRLPFNFTRSKYRESLSLGAFANVTDVSGYGLPVRVYSQTGNGTLYDTRYSLTYTRLIKTAPRDVLPRWGKTLSLYFRHTPFRGDFSGQILTAQAGFFLPGLSRHHAVWLRTGYQQEDLRRTARSYRFPTPLLFPRGFISQSFKHFLKGSVDYRFPILYPDLALWRFAYLQRIKGNVFGDAGFAGEKVPGIPFVEFGASRPAFYSVGLDLTADFNVLRLLPQLELGFRMYYLPQTGRVGFEFQVLDVGF